MTVRTFALSLFTCAFLVTAAAFATDLSPDVLVKSRWMELTRADYDRAVSNVPDKYRTEFSANPTRVKDVLNALLVTKTLAAQARAHGTRPAEVGPKGVGTAEERALAAGELARIENDAAHDFDAKKDAFEAKARETYDLDRDKYRASEEIRFSDIAIEIKDRGEDAARARALEARARLVGGEDFAKVAHEYSDDATTRDKGGALPFVTRNRLAKVYADGVFALKNVGEISQPIKAPSAYHIIRLDERHPERQLTFAEVRDRIMQSLRQRYVTEQRDLRISAINTDTTLEVNQPAIDALVTHIDPEAVSTPAPEKAQAASPK